ncbi:hypothetical protein [Zavarzinella formosa]|uniref:hypothetical protein n=1 Tax=Zavarzinella formosa TaxID=360055 RepID=UPI0002E0CDD3|nr:hypothetical protein [Zavarzinella formosa]
MGGVRRILFILVVILTAETVTAADPESPPAHTRPSQTPERSPQIINRDERSRPTDGTFGYDTRRPLFLSQSTVDRLFHYPADRRSGGYRTDGPHVFDILSIRPIKKSLHLEKGKAEE